MSSLAFILENYLKRTNTFIRFLLVGAVNTLAGLSIIFILLNLIGLSYWIATFIGNSMGAAISYILNRIFTFQSNASIQKSAYRFIFVILSSYFLSYSISDLAAEIVQDFNLLGYELSRVELAVFMGAAIYTLTNYVGQKYFVFK
ncbi:GtrA family protein [Bacillus sp. ISL-47]|uniref:GtrA family protein n=1 Tax=Bacillus sp. ISL-47 TaxID=2819130 RepID=UPI001BE82E4D|nr:GtrA family protein [Bacillus sp. ISL-47]MBT2690177.1 GtrA family protein [Bacillus sp. ISL-47]MBT2710374.1 GtrA family protein [Pseudomonas sp. ISL-84]